MNLTLIKMQKNLFLYLSIQLAILQKKQKKEVFYPHGMMDIFFAHGLELNLIEEKKNGKKLQKATEASKVVSHSIFI